MEEEEEERPWSTGRIIGENNSIIIIKILRPISFSGKIFVKNTDVTTSVVIKALVTNRELRNG